MVTVFGLGFVGLTTALGFANMGVKVYGVDVNEERKNTIRKGELPFLEPLMDEVLKKEIDKHFFVTDDVEKAIAESEIVYYCVGTPYGSNGAADLTYLFSAIDTTINAVKDDKFRVLVTKSTIPPSTTKEKIVPYVKGKGAVSSQFGVANNPEFLREGHCWEDFINADRIVLGVSDERSKKMLMDLYEPMNVPIIPVSLTTGEFIKYLSNTFLATMISYSNEMAELAETIGDINVADAFHILHMDKRWGGCNMTSYVYPGCGYGGYCLPKDTNALYAQGKEKGYEAKILGNVINKNNERPLNIAKQISRGIKKDDTVGILGLSFKPNSDDVRDTSAAKIIRELNRLGFENIVAYDPVATEEFKKHYPDLKVSYEKEKEAVTQQADVLAIVTAWPEFREVFENTQKPIVDARYMNF